MKKLQFYNYIYLDPRRPGKFSYPGLHFSLLFEPFYVGKGKNKRLFDHLRPYLLKSNSFKNNKIKNIISCNYEMESFIIIVNNNTASEDEIYSMESYIIRSIGIHTYGGPLTNRDFGGVGGTGRKYTQEEIDAKSGENHYMFGRNYDDIYGKEFARKIREKRSNTLKGHECYSNPARSKKLSDANKEKATYFNFQTMQLEKTDVNEFRRRKELVYKNNNFTLFKVCLNSETYFFRSIKLICERYSVGTSLIERLARQEIKYVCPDNYYKSSRVFLEKINGMEIKRMSGFEEIKKIFENHFDYIV